MRICNAKTIKMHFSYGNPVWDDILKVVHIVYQDQWESGSDWPTSNDKWPFHVARRMPSVTVTFSYAKSFSAVGERSVEFAISAGARARPGRAFREERPSGAADEIWLQLPRLRGVGVDIKGTAAQGFNPVTRQPRRWTSTGGIGFSAAGADWKCISICIVKDNEF